MKADTQAACAAAQRALQTAYELMQRDANESVKDNDPPNLVRLFADVGEEADVMRETMSAVAKLERSLSYEAIPACFDTHGIQNVRVQGYGLVSLNRRWSCSMIDKNKGFQYLRDAGQGGMIIETVNAMTLGAWARGQVEEAGVEPPDDIFKTSINRYCSLRSSS